MEEQKKIEPWNDPKTPMEKNGSKWAIIIGTTILGLIIIGMLIWAATSAH